MFVHVSNNFDTPETLLSDLILIVLPLYPLGVAVATIHTLLFPTRRSRTSPLLSRCAVLATVLPSLLLRSAPPVPIDTYIRHTFALLIHPLS
jgi:hypothetical protein